MKFLLLLTVALAAANFSSATLFNYSYNFGGNPNAPQFIAGTVEGTLNGEFVENITNATCFFNGIAMPGGVYIQGKYKGIADPDPAVMSFDGAQNHFGFSNYDLTKPITSEVTPNYWYAYIGISPQDWNAAWAQIDQPLRESLGIVMPVGSWSEMLINSTWSLSEAHKIPETGHSLMFLASGLAGIAAFRRLKPH